MVLGSYKVSVPGSMMLLGEHAVLTKGQAIAMAINKRIYLELIPNDSRSVTIEATNIGSYSSDLNALIIDERFSFVLAVINSYLGKIKSGFNLTIESEILPSLGLGSSAAVTLGVNAVLADWCYGKRGSNTELFASTRQLIQQVQKVASGTDLAASLIGGVVHYKTRSMEIAQLPMIPMLTVIYSGYKTKTVEVIRLVEAKSQKQPEKYDQLLTAIDLGVSSGIALFKTKNWFKLGRLLLQQQQIMKFLGVSDNNLEKLVNKLVKLPGILGSKISGSGLGDCILGIGRVEKKTLLSNFNKMQCNKGVELLDLAVTEQGLSYATT